MKRFSVLIMLLLCAALLNAQAAGADANSLETGRPR